MPEEKVPKEDFCKDSWFENWQLTIPQILKLTYFWVYKYHQELVIHELKLGSDHTIVDWYTFAREVCDESFQTFWRIAAKNLEGLETMLKSTKANLEIENTTEERE